MGLLEKAGKIQSDSDSGANKPIDEIAMRAPAVVEPEPVLNPGSPAKKARKRKTKTPKKTREPRAKRVRVVKEIPSGFEHATKGQKYTRRFVDLAVTFGWTIPIIGFTAWGSNFNPTIYFLLGLALIIGNLGILPTQTGRSMGNWVSRTRYVNARGEDPSGTYVLLKGLTTVFVLFGAWALAASLGSMSLGESTLSKIFHIFGILMILPPLIDYIMYKLRKDSKLGLWDTLFGGVWIVRTNKSAEAKGWLKRLESLGDFAESKGLLSEKEDSD
jgi:hypothetical protein